MPPEVSSIAEMLMALAKGESANFSDIVQNLISSLANSTIEGKAAVGDKAILEALPKIFNSLGDILGMQMQMKQGEPAMGGGIGGGIGGIDPQTLALSQLAQQQPSFI